MEIVYANGTQFPEKFKNGIAATVGFFDGVHSGHRYLIEQLRDIAKREYLLSVVITFSVHPRTVLQKDYQPKLLTSFNEKLKLLSETGIDYCIVIDFSLELSGLSAQSFIHDILFKQFNVRLLLVGYDHKFGKNREDGFENYKLYGNEVGMKVIQALPLAEKELHFSSTAVRDFLSQGKIREASGLLSHYYELEGTVVEGNRMGRELGFPTANIHVLDKNKLIPGKGIYAVFVVINHYVYKGMLYIGTRPSIFADDEIRIEVNIFDFSANLYGQSIIVRFVDYIRGDIKFPNAEDLSNQMKKDKIISISILDSAENEES